MKTCPNCGCCLPGAPDAAGSNSEREILIRVPERHFPLMRKTFRDMVLKLGMYGYGELANTLKPYGAPFNENRDRLRYFDDGALAMAMFGLTEGFPARAVTAPAREGRVSVEVEFTLPSGATRSMKVADNATQDAAAWFRGHLEDLAERLAPEREDCHPGTEHSEGGGP